MPILKIKDENGKVYEILALRGPRGLKGEDAYAKVVEYGYEGDEEEFYLAMSKNGKAPDKTLSIEGEAADAMVVGEEIQAARSYAEEVACDAAMGKAETKTFDVWVSGEEWADDGDPMYWQYIEGVDGIRATDNPIPSVAFGDDRAGNLEYAECFGKVVRIEPRNNAVMVWAKEVIHTSFPLRLQVIRG